MRKKVFIYVFILLLTMVFMGCSPNSAKEPPEISINIGDKEIEYVTAKNKWGGIIYDREDTFVRILKDNKDIPIFENDSIVNLTFKGNQPDKFTISDIIINENGRPLYTDKEIKNITAELNDDKYIFKIEEHFASMLSSYHEPNKKDIRGFRIIATWGANECEYAFVIKTYTK